jgi:hypothetical protein
MRVISGSIFQVHDAARSTSSSEQNVDNDVKGPTRDSEHDEFHGKIDWLSGPIRNKLVLYTKSPKTRNR